MDELYNPVKDPNGWLNQLFLEADFSCLYVAREFIN